VKRPDTYECRLSTDFCDLSERCDGVNDTCPPYDDQLPDGAPCDDGNACTIDERCINGICVLVGRVLNCDDGNACTDDTCDALVFGGCDHTPNTDPCDDVDVCTTGELCSGGVCEGELLDDGDDDGVCDLLEPCDDAVDTDVDEIGDPCDNCAEDLNPDQLDSDGDALQGDVCDRCPLDVNDACDPNQSAADTIGSGGGTLSTPDGSVSIEIPPGALARPTSISITEGVSRFEVGATRTILQTALGPEGKTFGEPVTITFTWDDQDNDGKVDGQTPGLAESNLLVFRDGVLLAGPCGALDFQDPTCARACCDTAANTWKVEVRGLSDFAVGAAEPRVRSGRLIVVRDKAGDPSKRRLVVLSRDPDLVVPAEDSPGDPTSNGGQLFLANPATPETDLFLLPASGWTALGRPPGSKGYRYRDRKLINGPCGVVVIKPGQLRAVCKGNQIGFSLDEETQGALTATLQLGVDPASCVAFGGSVLRDNGTGVKLSGTGLFRATDAPRLASCPLP
jgi:hypothetical protein